MKRSGDLGRVCNRVESNLERHFGYKQQTEGGQRN